MPKSASSSRSSSLPGSGEVSRVTSASSSASLLRLTRTRSASSTDSIPFPRFSPIDSSGVFKPVRTGSASDSNRSTPRRVTPGGKHILPKYCSNAPAWSPAHMILEEEGPPSGAVSRTSSAGSLPPSISCDISRTASAELKQPPRPLSRLSRSSSLHSIDSSLPLAVFESTTASGLTFCVFSQPFNT